VHNPQKNTLHHNLHCHRVSEVHSESVLIAASARVTPAASAAASHPFQTASA
jgi:hypothetical protein